MIDFEQDLAVSVGVAGIVALFTNNLGQVLCVFAATMMLCAVVADYRNRK